MIFWKWVLLSLWLIGALPVAAYVTAQRIAFDEPTSLIIPARFLVLSLMLSSMFGVVIGALLGNSKNELIAPIRVIMALVFSSLYLGSIWAALLIERLYVDQHFLGILLKSDLLFSALQGLAVGCVISMLTGGESVKKPRTSPEAPSGETS